MRRIIISILALSLILSVALYFQLQAMEAKRHRAAGGTGIIEATQVDISARIPARILAIHVSEGDLVKSGQVLAELDCSEPRAAYNQAQAAEVSAKAQVQATEAQVRAAALSSKAAQKAVEAIGAQLRSVEVGQKNALRQVKRVASMSQAGAISESRLDDAQTSVENLNHQIESLQANHQVAQNKQQAAWIQIGIAQAQVLAARGKLEAARAGAMRAQTVVQECILKAPRQGQVLSKNYEPGEVVYPGSNLITLIDLTEVRANFYLPNAQLAAAATGKPVTVLADAWPDQEFKGKIRHVSAKAEFTPRNVQTREDRDRLVYRVEVVLPNPDGKLRSGMPVEVSIDGTQPRP